MVTPGILLTIRCICNGTLYFLEEFSAPYEKCETGPVIPFDARELPLYPLILGVWNKNLRFEEESALRQFLWDATKRPGFDFPMWHHFLTVYEVVEFLLVL